MVETVKSDKTSSHCDPELEDSKPIFLHDILAHDVAPQYQVWLQKVQQQKRYHSDGIFHLFCDLGLDHKRAIKSFHKTIQLLIMCHQTKSSCKRIRNSKDILESHILIT